ncbi:solute carrier family 22 member 13-like [Amblyraja radiata]|uniref:solute carrier family 22 member 13-like n=1 Tax=Amblyraja radiata TaxID=386614 RepID=UPI0014027DD7|nr:solute carrier family 22 member 13-like [Amblyraja radiata]
MSEFGEILREVGEFGPFQKRLLLLLCLPYMFVGFHLLAQVFTGAGVPHHCRADWISNVTAGLPAEEQLFLTIPRERDGSYQSCKMYTPHPAEDLDWILLHGNQSTTACEEGWVYDQSQYGSTIVTEFNLVCDQRWLIQLSQTSSMVGLFVGAMLFGHLADSPTLQEGMSEFGEILREVGEFGPFQKRLLLLLCLPYMFVGFHLLAQVFTGAGVPHHCRADWISNVTAGLPAEEQLFLTIPRERDGSYQSCKMYTPHPAEDLDWILLHGNQSTTACEEGWVYDQSQYGSTIVTEFNLVCDQRWLIQLSQTSSMVGLFVGAMLFGHLADRIGRQRTILVSLLFQLLSGMGAAFAPNIALFIALQFVLGTAISGTMMNTIVLGTEWTGPAQRSFASVLTQCTFSAGQMLLAGLAYAIRDWRVLHLTTACPMLLFLSYIWLLPESARWLIMKGQKEEAKRYLRRAALLNKRVFNESLTDKVFIEKKTQQIAVWDLFRISSLRRVTLLLTFIWFVNCFVYYGLSFSVGSFGKNIYLTHFIFGLVETLRGSCIWLLAKFGRRKCQGCFLWLGGVSCLLVLAVPQGMAAGVTALAVLAKLSISCSFTVTYVYSTELLPTVLRQTGIGLVSMFARLGGIIVPLIMILDQDHPGISLILFGISSLVAGSLSLLLPETTNKEMPDHSGHVEQVKRSVPAYFSSEPGVLWEVNGRREEENGAKLSDAGAFTESTRM